MTSRAAFDWRGLVVPLALIGAAEAILRWGAVESGALAPPSAIARAWVVALGDGSLLLATAQTLGGAFGGLAVGGAIGLTLGVLMAMVPAAYRLAEVPLEAIRPIPSVALLPLVLLIFGLGFALEITLVAKTAMWPVFFMTIAAVRGVKRRLVEFSHLIRMNVFDRVTKIILPAAAPGVFLGFRLALGAALIVAITVEVAANPIGLGYNMMLAQERMQPALMFAFLFWIGFVGWSLNAGLLIAQRKLFARTMAEGEGV